MKAIRLLVPVLLATAACARGEHLTGTPAPQPVSRTRPARTPRVAYTEGADSNRAAAGAWDAAGSAALRSGLTVTPDFSETLSFPATSPIAASYRFALRRGERVEIELSGDRNDLFADVFEVIGGDIYRHVYAPEPGQTRFSYTAAVDGEHVLRVQPPIGRGGRYSVAVKGGARNAVTFPVPDVSAAAVAGVWGDPRDGGMREHKGVDIMAPRGSPVVAVADGSILKVEKTATGGRVIWERDASSGLLYFYAHLDEQLARVGQRVAAGDTIGRVGNTGNAAGSSTHLHFGVFDSDYTALNPAAFLNGRRISMSTDENAPPAELGSHVRLAADRVRLRGSPEETGRVIDQLDAGTDLLLLGYINGWSRVVLDNGTTGFVAGWLLGTSASAAR